MNEDVDNQDAKEEDADEDEDIDGPATEIFYPRPGVVEQFACVEACSISQ